VGLLRQLVLLPLAPVEGVLWIARQVQAQADRELLSSQDLWAELAELQLAADEGRISEQEYVAAESRLLDRMDALETGGASPMIDPVESPEVL
jgi:hypothetical protein